MKRLPLILTFFLLTASLSAIQDTIIIRTDDGSDLIARQLDSLTAQWMVQQISGITPFIESADTSAIIEFPDSIYSRRLKNIHSVVALPYNSIVRNHIHVYTGRKRQNFAVMLGLRDYYFPMIEDIFDSYGLPTELKYVAVIESALNPNAVSRVGATGLWQFMYSTGRAYGLTINSVVDERRDPVKSTHAAARFMKDLYKIYNDWGLVIAAYNCGPGNVNKAIRRSGNRKDYWEIYYRLPRETRGYLPGYIAATYSMNYYNEHNIRPVHLTMTMATDTIMVNRDLHFEQISAVLNIPIAELKALNPQYRASIIPGESQPMSLTLPVNSLGDFISYQDTISSYRADHYLSISAQKASPVKSANIPPDINGKAKLVYTVKSGDNMGYIASWYNVGLSDLRYWNNIYKNTINVGQKINIFVDPSRKDYYAAVNSLSFDEKQKRIGKSISSAQASASLPASSVQANVNYEYYTVRSGDTVWDIAKKFDGVTTTDILALNGLENSSRIQVGQKLKIRKKS
ncbi:MAG: LysM peptidoglycan-binding domain-containing protein [Bacteroidia bacterium]|nr:MAG: LysM peptidoglycan-binding domain-containing protein [Bacteroidia bacterium]